MPPSPDGDPAPADGSLPASALAGLGQRPFGVYVHVPFCAEPLRLLRLQHLHRRRARAAARRLARVVRRHRARRAAGSPRRVLGDARRPGRRRCSSAAAPRPCCPPTTWPGSSTAIDDEFGLAAGRRGDHRGQPRDGRPPRSLEALRAAGFTRISLRACSPRAPHVLAVLDRTHDPGRAAAGGRAEARDAGFDHVNLDLIYGTPGETRRGLAAPRWTPRWRCRARPRVARTP